MNDFALNLEFKSPSDKTSPYAKQALHDAFDQRHIGPRLSDQKFMLDNLGLDSREALIEKVIPPSLRTGISEIDKIGAPLSETEALAALKHIARKNQLYRSFIGQGYYGTETPAVILRNILENPSWYTAYTPYQPEISQGRLEALFNFQTMLTSLTGFPLANSSLLDEATAAAEAMMMAHRASRKKGDVFLVDEQCFSQTIDVVKTRARSCGLKVVVSSPTEFNITDDVFGVLFQYPGANGDIIDCDALVQKAKDNKVPVIVAADILSLVLLKSPAELGADIAVGSTQRFGVPMGFGGPHAGYMTADERFKRTMPGRIVGQSKDSAGNKVYRLSLQTREQHIRREKATSNICTAQVLLAVMASMYAVYHGPQGLISIAEKVQRRTRVLADGLRNVGFNITNTFYFDTLTVNCENAFDEIVARAESGKINLRIVDDKHLGVSLDETSTEEDVTRLLWVFSGDKTLSYTDFENTTTAGFEAHHLRKDKILNHDVFHRFHSETEMLRYMARLEAKDIALDRSMIPLGSCTMKLNATSEMLPVSWPEFSQLHPFVPAEQRKGYDQLFTELESQLAVITGYRGVSLQPNAGSQGEYAGLLAIAAYHQHRGEGHRNICLIPSSAHGTNPASAKMCAMDVVVVKCDKDGNVDVDDLREKAELHKDNLAAMMITYPSTHGVFEEAVREVCSIVHDRGGQVYIDGANLNAMVGLCYPGQFGGDVSHLNLHKTFCIPHGGGGPGMGPIGVAEHLVPFLPGHEIFNAERAEQAKVGPVSAAPWGSASILPISWMYIQMMGAKGLTDASEVAILNANYVANRLKDSYPILYTGEHGYVAHECIIDIRPIKDACGIDVEDIAKRLMDYGFHAPTMSFPVAGTLMIEPTESESLEELDRFCDAMLAIYDEVQCVLNGTYTLEDNPLVNAPHTAEVLLSDEWTHSYSRKVAAYPLPYVRENKYWPPVGRVDNIAGDRNLICSCPSMDSYR